jgi:lactate permease
MPPLTLLNTLLAALPLIAVLYLMIAHNWSGSRAGMAGWATAVILALFVFGGDGALIAVSFGKSLLLSFFVLYIIWMALFLYHAINEAGAIMVIGGALRKLTSDQAGQALLLGWVFGSFLQGAAGFGVPAAVVAPLLVGVGLKAETAVVVALVGHAWAVTFGSLGSSFFTLIAATDLTGAELAGPSAALLAVACLGCAIAVLWAVGGAKAVRRRGFFALRLSLVMGGAQWLLAVAGFWSLAAFGAAMLGVGVAVLDLRFFSRQSETGAAISRQGATAQSGEGGVGGIWRRLRADGSGAALFAALLPYMMLTAVILIGQTVLQTPLNQVVLNWQFPEIGTTYGWTTAAGPGQGISLFGHPGALLLYGSLLTFFWFRWRGVLQEGLNYDGRAIFRKTVRSSTQTTVSIITLLAMAVTMQYAGMTQLLAESLSRQTGAVYPLLSPFIGALGAFMTGSNANSNVVFGQLQQQTAAVLGLSIPWILAGQTAGGAIGSIFAPAKVIIGCSTVAAPEGIVLKRTAVYGVLVTAVISLVVLVVSR